MSSIWWLSVIASHCIIKFLWQFDILYPFWFGFFWPFDLFLIFWVFPDSVPSPPRSLRRDVPHILPVCLFRILEDYLRPPVPCGLRCASALHYGGHTVCPPPNTQYLTLQALCGWRKHLPPFINPQVFQCGFLFCQMGVNVGGGVEVKELFIELCPKNQPESPNGTFYDKFL